jgi:hypothetical protein
VSLDAIKKMIDDDALDDGIASASHQATKYNEDSLASSCYPTRLGLLVSRKRRTSSLACMLSFGDHRRVEVLALLHWEYGLHWLWRGQ